MNTWGYETKLSLFGESHAQCIGVTYDVRVAGCKIDMNALRAMLLRRAPAGRRDGISTQRNETDEFEIISGLKDGITTGTPITAIFKNADVRSHDYSPDIMRPSHADYSAHVKYNGFNDSRGGGQFSGRMTAALTFAGAIALQLLQDAGISVFSHIFSIGNCFDVPFGDSIAKPNIADAFFPLIDERVRGTLLDEIERNKPDSTGGAVECAVIGAPPGLGEPFFDTVEGELSRLVFSIPGVRAVEFGNGVDMSRCSGLCANDPPYFDNNGNVYTRTNHSGGINGGLCNGMPIVFRAYFRPTPSIPLRQATVNIKTGENTHTQTVGRFDSCILPRVCPVVEAAAALSVYDLYRRM